MSEPPQIAFPDADVIRSIAGAYPLESDVGLFERRPPWTADGAADLHDIYSVVGWKAPRVKQRFLDSEVNRRLDIRMLTSSALGPFCEVEPRDLLIEQIPAVVDRLCQMDFVGVRVASAILAVFRPELFTVLDWRAWAVLAAYQLPAGLMPRSLDDPGTYAVYLRQCHQLAAGRGVSLRNLDRCLWVLGGTSSKTHHSFLELREAAVANDAW